MKKFFALSLVFVCCFAEQFKTDISYEKFYSQDELVNKMFPNEIIGELILEKTHNEKGELVSVKRYIESTRDLVFSEEYENGIIKTKSVFFNANLLASIKTSEDLFLADKMIFMKDELLLKCFNKPYMQLLYDEKGFLKMLRTFDCAKQGEYLMKSETPYIYVEDRNRSLEHGIEKIYENGELAMELSYKFGKLDGKSKCYERHYCDEYEVVYKDGKKLDKAIPY